MERLNDREVVLSDDDWNRFTQHILIRPRNGVPLPFPEELCQRKDSSDSTQNDKEKKSKVKEQKPHAIHGTKKVKAKIQKKAGKGKPEKPPPVQPPSDSDVSVEIQVPFVCFVLSFCSMVCHDK